MTADEVLISSPRCGLVRTPPDENSHYTDYLTYISKMITSSASYAQQCYGESVVTQGCSIYVKKQIFQKTLTNASCPFPGKDKICILNSTNLSIDSGMIDSHKDLGINAAPKDRFTYRNVLECAPLQTDGYEQVVTRTSDGGNSSSVVLHYGHNKEGRNQSDTITFSWPTQARHVLQEYTLR